MKSPRYIVALICSSLGCLSVLAQPASITKPVMSGQERTTQDPNSIRSALNLRMEIAAAVTAGREKPEDAVKQLKTQVSPTGLNIDADADFAFAANDIGQRLVVVNKRVEALMFFTEAEKSLTAVIERTPDQSARDKAQYLAIRADLRARYLNQPAAAKADIIAAVSLQPKDDHLQRLYRKLGSDRGEYFKDAVKN